MYMAELAPASIRGGLINFYQSWLYVGAILASALVYAAQQHLHDQWVYLLRECDNQRLEIDLKHSLQYVLTELGQLLSCNLLCRSCYFPLCGSSLNPLVGSYKRGAGKKRRTPSSTCARALQVRNRSRTSLT